MQKIKVFETLKEKFDAKLFLNLENEEDFVLIKNKDLKKVSLFLKENDFNMLSLITAVDNIENFSLFYHFLSIKENENILIKVDLEKEAPKIDTISDIFESANWFERECFDLMGINFLGHPNLTRILLPLDWEGYPLRKDYEMPTEYHGIKKDNDF